MKLKFLKFPLFWISILLWLILFYFEFEKGYQDQKNLTESNFVKIANDLSNKHSRISDLLNYQRQIFLSHQSSGASNFHLKNLSYSKEFEGYYGKDNDKYGLGSLTVLGHSIDEETKEYINRSISLTPLFREAKKIFPRTPWFYYTNDKFIYIFPFVDHKKFFFKRDYLDLEYYKLALPQNNPNRDMFWTNPYSDEAGMGMMVTACLPVYKNGVFVGTLSLDVNLHEFSDSLSLFELGRGDFLILNKNGKVIVSDLHQNKRGEILSSVFKEFTPHAFVLGEYRNKENLYFTYYVKDMGFYLIHRISKISFYLQIFSGMIFSIVSFVFFVLMNLIYAFYVKIRNRIEADNVNRNKLISLAEMSGGIAHEINNPLSVIKGRAEQLYKNVKRKTADETYILSSLERIHYSTERIALIVKALKNFSRDGLNDPMVSTELDAIIKDTLLLSEIKIRTSDITIDIAEIPKVSIICRPYQLAQVLINLINNAYDAVEVLPEKWIKIRFDLIGKIVRIKVVDSGNGIPKEILSKIFDPFFTSKGHSGTGIGLSISKRIVIDHGGNLFYDAKQSNTTFVLELPCSIEIEN